MAPQTFRCYLVSRDGDGRTTAEVQNRPLSELPDADVLIRVAYSSLNYKDALAATGHPGVVRKFPHVPGIDAAGVVAESRSPKFRAGDEVVVTGFDLGAGQWGGFAQYIRVPADWVVPLPSGLSLKASMILGTAGFTAGQSVAALIDRGLSPQAGEIAVTGASGGVGSLAVALLAKLGYSVVAVSGKASAHDLLRQLGAREVIGRDQVDDRSAKPLLAGRWAGAVDTVGGNTLATLLRSTKSWGCVTACGLVGGAELAVSVYPFILRGVSLVGIDSAWWPMDRRLELWSKLAGPWRPALLESLATQIDLSQVDQFVREMLAGRVTGRTVIEIGD